MVHSVSEYLTVESLVALLTLTALEIVLGIDNIIFIAIQAGNLPADQREKGRKLGLLLAVVSRIGLLMGVGWVLQLTHPIGTLLGHEITGKDLVMLAGGLFLIRQATVEIHHKVEGRHQERHRRAHSVSLKAMLIQVTIMDMVFSLDSVITAIGLCTPKQLPIMIAAVLVSVGVMLVYSGAIVRFVDDGSGDQAAGPVVSVDDWRLAGRRRISTAHRQGLRLLSDDLFAHHRTPANASPSERVEVANIHRPDR